MSEQVKGLTQIKNANILKEVLTSLNIEYTEDKDKISWGSGYSKMTVDMSTGEVKYDNMYGSTLAQIKRDYTTQFLRYEILKKGHKIESIKHIGEKIEIIANY